MAKLKVVVRFRDKIDHRTWYNPGDVVEFNDEARVKTLVGNAWVEVIDEAPVLVAVFGKKFDRSVVLEALKSIKEGANPNIGADTLETKIEKFNDEKKDALKKALGIEDQKEENVELIDGKFIGIVSNPDGTRTAYGEDNGEKVILASGEYRSSSLVYVVGENGNVIDERESEE